MKMNEYKYFYTDSGASVGVGQSGKSEGYNGALPDTRRPERPQSC